MDGEGRPKGVGLGAGCFSQYQCDAWSRIPEVQITAMYNRTRSRGEALRRDFGIPRYYDDYREMIDAEKPDFMDCILSGY